AGGEAALGLDTHDPASKDDVVSGVMVVPVNREIEVILRAQDVIHSFFVPSMRFKQDAVPGLAIHMHFTPVETGDYEIACAELCGRGHYKMHGMLKVVSQDEFDKWLTCKEAEKQLWRLRPQYMLMRPRRASSGDTSSGSTTKLLDFSITSWH